MARILIAANSIWNIRNFRSGLIRALVDRGHDVVTVAPGPQGVELDEMPIRHRPCSIDRSGTNLLREIKSLRGLARIVREERPHLFLSFTIKPNIYGSLVCRFLKVPAIPNVSGLGTTFLGGSAFRCAVLMLYRIAFARAGTVFFQNPDDRDLFVSQKIVRPCQAVVLPGSGVDLSHFVPDVLPRDLSFLMIGRLLRDKGVYEFVEAARKLKARLPDATFSILGEIDPQNPTAIPEHQIEQWTAQGVIEYAGSAHDVRPFIRRSSAIVLPSYREGLPRTLLEGAAMGRPLIGTDVPGCRQLVRDGSTGFLCRAADADSLAAAMERFAAMPYVQRARMGERARAMAEEEFDEGLVIGIYLDAAERLTSEAPDHARKPGR